MRDEKVQLCHDTIGLLVAQAQHTTRLAGEVSEGRQLLSNPEPHAAQS